MVLLTIVFHGDREEIIEEIGNIKECFKAKKVNIGVAESISSNTHFVKIYCDDENFNEKIMDTFNIYIANVLYKIVMNQFYKQELQNFLSDTYFFLKYDEIAEIKDMSLKALISEGEIADESAVYCINQKNKILDKIKKCIEENKEINIDGFIRFRMKELTDNIENIIDKVVEKYMVEKEYDEFIKLLKYFVDIQESKMSEVNIIIHKNGEYSVNDENGKDVTVEMISDFKMDKYTRGSNIEDFLISALITNAPKKVIIHSVQNCKNKEFIKTIESVFENRVKFCDDCKICIELKEEIKN